VPQGRALKCFFQRHGGTGLPESIGRRTVAGNAGGPEEYRHIDDPEGPVADPFRRDPWADYAAFASA